MKQTKQKQIIPENKLKEITGGAQIRDVDVSRPTPVDEGGSLVSPVVFCSVCNTVITSADRQCARCIANAQNPVGTSSDEKRNLVQVPPGKIR